MLGLVRIRVEVHPGSAGVRLQMIANGAVIGQRGPSRACGGERMGWPLSDAALHSDHLAALGAKGEANRGVLARGFTR